eukprot:TRINITY_DN13664_c0_g1_i1.p1 TRINITY_DN13664_c0_g1~~TRINITY_DN13664_c0_g1_i1.p1  ORF type:complete len:187 (-),score=42.45 TRINITY_DN13664_c0_g1_i1:424-903(-)
MRPADFVRENDIVKVTSLENGFKHLKIREFELYKRQEQLGTTYAYLGLVDFGTPNWVRDLNRTNRNMDSWATEFCSRKFYYVWSAANYVWLVLTLPIMQHFHAHVKIDMDISFHKDIPISGVLSDMYEQEAYIAYVGYVHRKNAAQKCHVNLNVFDTIF